jgi:hypothetical protein
MTKVCVVEGCDQPRMMSKQGKELTRCEAHQREYWREAAKGRSAPAAPKPKPTRAEKETQPTVTSDAPPEAAAAEADTVAQAAAMGCEWCIYRELIEKLAAKDRRISELVAALERVRELEREMFDPAPKPPTAITFPGRVTDGSAGERLYRGEALVIDGSELLRVAVAGVEAPGLPGDGDLARLMQRAGGSGQMVLHPVDGRDVG